MNHDTYDAVGVDFFEPIAADDVAIGAEQVEQAPTVPQAMVKVWAEEMCRNNDWLAGLGGDPQEHQHQPEPERHAQQEPHLATARPFRVTVAPFGRTHSRLPVRDKSQVFALRLTERKFAKNAAK